MRILENLASALEARPADLLLTEADREVAEIGGEGIAIINERSRDRLLAPGVKRRKVSGDSDRVLCVPGLHALSALAAYLPDDSMAPAFGKGDLVVFSLSRQAVDGDACLVDTGAGEVVFRTVLALPGRKWRLQPGNPRYEPVVIKATKAVRMWPAIGRWQMLPIRPRR